VERVTRRFRITGKVQGVYFRHSTRKEAERLGLVGVARNLQDGSVEVIAQGAPEAVANLHEWLARGPSMARVDGVEELESQRRGETQGDGHVWQVFSVE
jgi:acylphosphatase